MKKALITMLALSLTGCGITGYMQLWSDLGSDKTHVSNQDNRCIENIKPLILWHGHKVHIYQKYFITPTSVADERIRTHKKTDTIDVGTKFRVNRVYEGYKDYWRLRVNVEFLQGKNTGIISELSGFIYPPNTPLFTYYNQGERITKSEDLAANTVTFNPEFFKYCDE
ncbi:hypothetical protein VH441_03780 [Psychrobacter sp. HD31]|uniref:hypothetical protein n=1 Tax=Psychrobacter sp. HD31 TaxID=3112003 RepID=UPI003DA6C138